MWSEHSCLAHLAQNLDFILPIKAFQFGPSPFQETLKSPPCTLHFAVPSLWSRGGAKRHQKSFLQHDYFSHEATTSFIHFVFLTILYKNPERLSWRHWNVCFTTHVHRKLPLPKFTPDSTKLPGNSKHKCGDKYSQKCSPAAIIALWFQL